MKEANVTTEQPWCCITLMTVENMLLRLSITDSKSQSSTDKCIFRYRQSSVRWLLSASGFCRARSNQIVDHILNHETVLGSSRMLGEAAKHLIDGSEKRFCQLTLEF